MMNSQQQGIRKAPFIYPEYLSQMTAKMKPKKTAPEEQSPILSAMKDGLLFAPTQGLGDTTNIDDLKRTPSSSTATTAGETTSSALPPKTQYYPKSAQHQQDDSLTAASDPLPTQPMIYSSTHPMNRSMFMNQRTPMGGFMSNAFSGGFSNLFSRKPIIPEHESIDEYKDDQSVHSTASSTRRLLFPENPIMLIPTPSKGSMTPNRSSYKSPKKTPTRTPTRSRSSSHGASPTISPLPPPSIPSSPPDDAHVEFAVEHCQYQVLQH